ncbi:hypothetical protein [Streptomyces sp. NPDC060188]|uniref:hypothetical protein n=1 Tax=Streptomyces sp. NPDC060188 TaxID=3347068 RepID=UPI00365FF1F3
MHSSDLLHLLGVTVDDLEHAPPEAPIGSSGKRRLAEGHRCLRCGRPATVAGVLDIPGRGRLWVDRCTPCMVATTSRSDRQPAPLEDVLAILRDAALEARVPLRVILEDGHHGC